MRFRVWLAPRVLRIFQKVEHVAVCACFCKRFYAVAARPRISINRLSNTILVEFRIVCMPVPLEPCSLAAVLILEIVKVLCPSVVPR